MKCPIENRENTDLLLAYCGHKLDPETQTILERHIAVCPACQKFEAEQDAVWQALDAWEAVPVSQDFNRRLYHRIEEEEARASWWSRLLRPVRPMFEAPLMSRSVPLAAALCLLVLAGVILQRPNTVTVNVTEDAERIEAVQPDQVERSLDDMEMLRQFRVNSIADTGMSSNVNSM